MICCTQLSYIVIGAAAGAVIAAAARPLLKTHTRTNTEDNIY